MMMSTSLMNETVLWSRFCSLKFEQYSLVHNPNRRSFKLLLPAGENPNSKRKKSKTTTDRKDQVFIKKLPWKVFS